MDIPSIKLTAKEFKALTISKSGAYDQPRCRFQTSKGQWILIDGPKQICAVIEIK